MRLIVKPVSIKELCLTQNRCAHDKSFNWLINGQHASSES